MNKRISYNLIGQLVSFVCSLGISFFVTPYIVNNLGAEVYGFVGLANNFTNYIVLLLVAINGMLSRYVTVEYTKKNYEAASGFFSTAVLTQIILAAVLFIPMMLFAGHMENFVNISPDIVPDVKILWVMIFFAFLAGLPMYAFATSTFATNRLEIQAIISILSNVVKTITLLVTFFFFTPHVWYIGLATIAANTVTMAGSYIVHKRLTPQIKISRKYFDRKYIYKLIVVGIWNSLNRLQQILVSGLDLLLTNLFIDGTQMGLLSVAKQLPTQISVMISTVAGAFEPSMTIAYGEENEKEFLKQTQTAMKLCGFLCSVPVLGMICFGINFYSLWMPSLVYADIIKVQILAVLTLLPEVFSIYVFPLYTVNMVTCKLKVPVLVSLGIGILNVIIVYVLLKYTGLGVYAVAGVSSILWVIRIFTFLPMYAAKNINQKVTVFYKPLLMGVLNTVVVGTVFTVIAHFLYANSWLSFMFICLVAGIVGYIVSFMIMFNHEEKKNVINKILKK